MRSPRSRSFASLQGLAPKTLIQDVRSFVIESSRDETGLLRVSFFEGVRVVCVRRHSIMPNTNSALTVALTYRVHFIAPNDAYCTSGICVRASKTRFLGKYAGFHPIQYRIQCPGQKISTYVVTYGNISSYSDHKSDISAHVSKMLLFWRYSSPFFRLIRTPVSTIDWIL